MAQCVICLREVPAGPALLILQGELLGDSRFAAKSKAGPACNEHLGEGSKVETSRFPMVFHLS